MVRVAGTEARLWWAAGLVEVKEEEAGAEEVEGAEAATVVAVAEVEGPGVVEAGEEAGALEEQVG